LKTLSLTQYDIVLYIINFSSVTLRLVQHANKDKGYKEVVELTKEGLRKKTQYNLAFGYFKELRQEELWYAA